MNREDFNKLRERLLKDAAEVNKSKGRDYTLGDEDVLYNFKSVGKRLGQEPKQVLMVYMLKHFDSICAYVKTDGESQSEPIEGRIVDAINYLILLAGLIQDGDTDEEEERRRAQAQAAMSSREALAKAVQAARMDADNIEQLKHNTLQGPRHVKGDMNDIFVESLLKLAAKYDCTDRLGWTEDLEFHIVCNDTFTWASADATEIDGMADVADLEQAIIDTGDEDGPDLYCARKCRMRPQGAVYKYLAEKNWPLFDACGPEREVNDANPYPHPRQTNKEGDTK